MGWDSSPIPIYGVGLTYLLVSVTAHQTLAKKHANT